MILIVSSSNREASVLMALCDHRQWTSYNCGNFRDYQLLQEKISPRVIIVRQRFIDGYSDDIMAYVRDHPPRFRPRIIVLALPERNAAAEARQIAIGADCVLHDPIRMEILMEYIEKYLKSANEESPHPDPAGRQRSQHSFCIADVEVFPHEHYIEHKKQTLHVAPQEIALLRILAHSPGEVVSYPVLYGDLFGRRFDGDTTNCRVLLGKVSASFSQLQVKLRDYIQVIPKSGYLYTPGIAGSHMVPRTKTLKSNRRDRKPKAKHKTKRLQTNQ